jgi:subtilisin family serine protease
MQLSGTSFAAPVVSGIAAQILALRPHWTPDQVKGALMATARPVPNAPFGAAGVGQVTATTALLLGNAPNPNAALNRFVVPDPAGGSTPVFDAAAWSDTAQSDAAWASAAWADAAWSSAAWSSAAWSSAAWSSAAWASAAWADAAWASAAWADTSFEDAAKGDELTDATATDTEQAETADAPEFAFPDPAQQ